MLAFEPFDPTTLTTAPETTSIPVDLSAVGLVGFAGVGRELDPSVRFAPELEKPGFPQPVSSTEAARKKIAMTDDNFSVY